MAVMSRRLGVRARKPESEEIDMQVLEALPPVVWG
jgi:hypothetical protein